MLNEIEALASLRMKQQDEAILKSFIGSKILDFKITPIPHRKRMYLVMIHTDANPVLLDNLLGGGQVFADPSKLTLKVKL